MNKSLHDLIREFPVYRQDGFRELLQAMTQGTLAERLEELFCMYYNDLNSSSLREMAVVLMMGFDPNPGKIGYDGHRVDPATGRKRPCEAKPVNVRRDSANPKKLNGGGNFTDYSWQKFQRHQKENPIMLVAGFVDGKLIYIFEFPFNTPSFVNRLEEQLERRFPDGDKANEYLRSASFTFKHYAGSPGLKAQKFVTNHELDEDCKGWITAHVRDCLRELSHE